LNTLTWQFDLSIYSIRDYYVSPINNTCSRRSIWCTPHFRSNFAVSSCGAVEPVQCIFRVAARGADCFGKCTGLSAASHPGIPHCPRDHLWTTLQSRPVFPGNPPPPSQLFQYYPPPRLPEKVTPHFVPYSQGPPPPPSCNKYNHTPISPRTSTSKL
jgi:hypothetical protein